jgi:hypothetical protein
VSAATSFGRGLIEHARLEVGVDVREEQDRRVAPRGGTSGLKSPNTPSWVSSVFATFSS